MHNSADVRRQAARAASCSTRRCSTPATRPARRTPGGPARATTSAAPPTAAVTTSTSRSPALADAARGQHRRPVVQVQLGHRVGLRLRLRADHDRRRQDLHLARVGERLHDVQHRPAGRQPQPERLPGRPTTTASPAPAAPTQAGSEAIDRKLGNTPEAVFLADSYDISDLAGAETTARCGSATPPTRAWPGRAGSSTTSRSPPHAVRRAGPARDRLRDRRRPRRPARLQRRLPRGLTTAQQCTQGWKYLKAGAESEQDHAYYLEMRDRSGFDLDGHGQIDRDPIGWRPGLYLAYTDEAHGYGNAGTDDPPAQSPLDSTPDPGQRDARPQRRGLHRGGGRSTFSDSGEGHIDNYADPSSTDRATGAFRYDCLGFEVLSMTGDDVTARRRRRRPDRQRGVHDGQGLRRLRLRLRARPVRRPNTAPTAKAGEATPIEPRSVSPSTFTGAGSTDAETPDDLDYSWDFGNGGSHQGRRRRGRAPRLRQAGTYDVTLHGHRPAGRSPTPTVAGDRRRRGGGHRRPRRR